MRANRKNNRAPRTWLACAALTLAAPLLSAADAPKAAPAPAPAPAAAPAPPPPAAPAPPPAAPVEVAWDVIESWASGNAVEGAKVAVADTKKKTDTKPADTTAPAPAPAPAGGGATPPTAPARPETPPAPPPPDPKAQWTAPHPGEHRAEPAQIAEIRAAFSKKAEFLADRAEKSKDFDRAWQLFYRAERYLEAINQLSTMKNDPKHFPNRETYIKEKWLETCVMMVPQPRAQIDLLCKEFKDPRVEQAKKEPNKDAQARMLDDLKMAEEVVNMKPNATEGLVKREAAGEADANILWDLSQHYVLRKFRPRRCGTCLCSTSCASGFPEFEPVKSGEVQLARLANVLAHQLEINKEAADEAHFLSDIWSKNQNVTNGEALWIECRRIPPNAGRTGKF